MKTKVVIVDTDEQEITASVAAPSSMPRARRSKALWPGLRSGLGFRGGDMPVKHRSLLSGLIVFLAALLAVANGWRPSTVGGHGLLPAPPGPVPSRLALSQLGLVPGQRQSGDLYFATYLGGTGSQFGQSIAVGDDGAIYIAGSTYSADFPATPGAFQTTFGGGTQPSDAFVAKFTPDGTGLLYATFLGGSGDDRAYGLAVTTGGEVIITGHTNSADFPTTPGAHQETYGGGLCGIGYPCFDSFVTRLNADGSTLVYSTYLGDDQDEIGWDLTVDAGGAVLIAGTHTITSTVTQSASEAFVKKLSADGDALLFTTWLDGSEGESATAIALGDDGDVFVAGLTTSDDFPTTPGAYQPLRSGGFCGIELPYPCADFFIARLNGSTGAPVYATYLGGSVDESRPDIDVDPAGAAYVTGQSESADFPTVTGALQETFGGGRDAIVSKLSPDGGTLEYSTFRGGAGDELAGSIEVTDAGTAAYIYNATGDLAIEVLNRAGSELIDSAALGGSAFDSPGGIALSDCCVYLTGFTLSDDFPTSAGAYQTVWGGDQDAFLARVPAVFTLDYTVLTTAQGFDTCEAPDEADLQLWRDQGTPYQYIGIYIGGSTRYCPQLELDAAWVAQSAAQPWQFIPIWAGPQAPCRSGGLGISDDPNVAFSQGVQEAQAALDAAFDLGLAPESRSGTIIYYDMERFEPTDAACGEAVGEFVSGWVSELRAQGSKAGVYGHAVNVDDWHSIANVPDAVWIAAWYYQGITDTGVLYHDYDPEASVYGIPAVPDGHWPDDQRLRQYAGDHDETYGGLRLSIDSNAADGPVAIPVSTGLTLNLASSPVSAPIAIQGARFVVQDMDLISPVEGWALVNRRLLWTTTGGASWQDITPPELADKIPLAVYFLDNQHGWMMSILPGALGDPAQLFFSSTSDGGQTWGTDPFTAFSSNAGLAAVHLDFIDAQTGWVAVRFASSSNVSEGTLFTTADGGASWDERILPGGHGTRFITPDIGWTIGGPAADQLYWTVDGAVSWQLQDIVPPAGGAGYVIYQLPTFDNAQDGVIPIIINDLIQTRVEFYATQNSGQSWNLTDTTVLDRAVRPGTVFPMSVIDSSNWVLANAASLPNLPAAIADLDFISPALGWAYTSDRSCGDGAAASAPANTCTVERSLLMTADGGRTWVELPLPVEPIFLPLIQTSP